MISTLPLRAIAGELHSDYAGADIAIANICTDSRQVRAGDLYVALQGERFDGHDFIDAVAAKGAAAAIVSAPRASALPQLTVADTRKALGLIARMNRRRFRGPVIGITGSAGKTSCKEMLAAILSQQGETLATQGNLNNEIGVPQTLLRIAPEHRYAVIEMGAARAGDIGYLCRFAEPDIALVTSALPAHLEGFGSIDTIAATKGEIYTGLRADGIAIINADSEYQPLWRQLAGSHRVITFGFSADAGVSASAIQRSASGVQFTLHTSIGDASIELQLLGLHNVRNALAAAACAIAAGGTLQSIRTGLAQVCAVPGRLQARQGVRGEIVIDDSYNANPGAVKAAIDVLAEYSGVRQLILGNMAELGPEAEELHRDVARYAREKGIDVLWCVGPHAAVQVEAFLECGSAAPHSKSVMAKAFADNAALIRELDTVAPAVVLVKGSRSAGTEVIVAALCGDHSREGAH
jgi:UDP-N-acetylmuramoyl-tripeptide--D-alanyl-D-alanine ligase